MDSQTWCPRCFGIAREPRPALCPFCGSAIATAEAERLRSVVWRLDAIAGAQRELAGEADGLLAERAELFQAVAAEVAAPVAPTTPAMQPRAEWRPDVVKNLLLWLGAGLVGLAALIFAIVAWAHLAAGGRAGLLLGFTALAAAGVVATRRALPATSEALATLGLGLVLVDWYALQKTGLDHPVAGELWWAGGFALTALLAAGAGQRLKLTSARLLAGLTGLFAGFLAVLAVADAGWTIGLGWAAVATAGTIAACALDGRRASRSTAGSLAGGAVLVDVAAVVAIAIATTDRLSPGLAAAAPVAAALAATGIAPLAALALARGRRVADWAGLFGAWAGAAALAALATLAAPAAPGLLSLVVVAMLGLAGLFVARLSNVGWFPLRDTPEPAAGTSRGIRAGRGASLVAAGCSAIAAAGIGPQLVRVTVGPLRWLGVSWQGRWSTPAASVVGYTGRSGAGDVQFGGHPWVPLAVLAALVAISVVAASPRLRQRRLVKASLAFPLGLGAAMACVLASPVAAGGSLAVAWAVALGCCLVLAAAGVQRHHAHASMAWLFDAAALISLVPATGLALATRSTSLATVALVAVGALVAALVLQRGKPQLVATGLTAVAGGLGAAAVVPAAGGSAAQAGLALSVASAVAVLLALLPRLGDGRDRLLDVLGVAGLTIGSVLASDAALWRCCTLTVATLTFALAGGLSGRRSYQLRAAGTAVLAAWAWFAWFDVSLLEAYSLPPALAAGAVGWSIRRHRPAVGSWLAYGGGLAIGFVPSLVAALDDGGPRSIMVVGCAVATVGWGAARHLQAPLVVGATAVIAIAVDTLWPVAMQVPRWAAIGGAGMLFLWLGATAERRLGQLRRLGERYESLA